MGRFDGVQLALHLHRYRVRIMDYVGERDAGVSFRKQIDGVRYADRLAEREQCLCEVHAVLRGRTMGTIARIEPDGPDDGGAGTREPRRPLPGSSSTGAALDLPD